LKISQAQLNVVSKGIFSSKGSSKCDSANHEKAETVLAIVKLATIMTVNCPASNQKRSINSGKQVNYSPLHSTSKIIKFILTKYLSHFQHCVIFCFAFGDPRTFYYKSKCLPVETEGGWITQSDLTVKLGWMASNSCGRDLKRWVPLQRENCPFGISSRLLVGSWIAGLTTSDWLATNRSARGSFSGIRSSLTLALLLGEEFVELLELFWIKFTMS